MEANYPSSVDFFLGTTTPAGFKGYFQQLRQEPGMQLYLLKSGPGCGKSTLLKQLAQRAPGPVQRIHCASDPDSLDGVVFCDRAAAILDATAPHTLEPLAPGADEVVVSLYHTIDAEALRPHRAEIRALFERNASLRSHAAPFILSPLYFLLLAAIILAAAAAYFIIRKYLRDNRNTALVRGRRANKVAVQRFRTAERYMKEQNQHAFYEEMLRALWGYMSDRFNIPVADLTKESIREELSRRGITDEARRVTEIISKCEEAQYSPVASSQMNEVYAEGIDIISKVESAIKR